MTTVTVAVNHRLSVNISGHLIVFDEGTQVDIPTFEVASLRRAGVIV